MKTISILGSGWLGLPLAEQLLKRGHPVKASTRSQQRLTAIEAVNAKPYIVDIDRLREDIQEFLSTDILIVNITSKNIASYKSFIDQIECSSTKQVIFVSSTSVYKNTNRIISESDDAVDRDNPLFQIENLFRSSQRFQTTIIRLAGLIGYSRHPGRFFGERKIPQPEAPVNLIHRDDCINILAKTIQLEIWGEVFNACADTHPSKREYYSQARQNLGLAVPEFEEPTEQAYKIISSEKIKHTLSYRFKYADLLKSGL